MLHLIFVFFWWASAALAASPIMRFPDGGIAVAALTGLALGIILDAVCLKRWIARFDSASFKLMGPVYLCCSVIAMAFFMGLPLGNLVLGTLAGAYVGRREYHSGKGQESIANTAQRVGVFIALITGVEALLIGLLAREEGIVMQVLHVGLGMNKAVLAGPMGVGLIILVCIALMVLQFWCTRKAVRFAFGRGKMEAACRQFIARGCSPDCIARRFSQRQDACSWRWIEKALPRY
jgi:hypothetical protein